MHPFAGSLDIAARGRIAHGHLSRRSAVYSLAPAPEAPAPAKETPAPAPSTDAAAVTDAPVAALNGVSDSDAEHLKAAFNIKTVRDLGTNKFFLWAQATAKLAE